MGIRALRRARTLRAINVEGLALIGRCGVDGWTMADLARAVGLTPGAFYRYFRSKEEIIAAVQVSVLHELLEGWGVVEAELGGAMEAAEPGDARSSLVWCMSA